MNKFNLHLAFYLGLTAVVLSNSTVALASEPSSTPNFNNTVANWRSVTKEALQRPENSDVVRQLKESAQDRRQTSARALLIRLGDEDTIQDCLNELKVNKSGHRNPAVKQLSEGGNADIIPRLETILDKEESPEIVFSGDTGILPVSMASASIIKAIILENPAFPNDVKVWAQNLPKVSVGLRDGIRTWYHLNKSLLVAKDYKSVVRTRQ